MTSLTDRLAAAYAAVVPALEAQRRRDLADQYRRDDRMERVLEIKRTDPAAYAALPASVLIGVGLYRQHQIAHVAAEGDLL